MQAQTALRAPNAAVQTFPSALDDVGPDAGDAPAPPLTKQGPGGVPPPSLGEGRIADTPELEVVPSCTICGGGDAVASDTIRWRETDLHYVICSGCGLKYMNPRPTERWYAAFYASAFWQEKVTYRGYHRAGTRRTVEADVGTQRRVEKQRWRARKIESILKRVVRLSPQTTVLEIGAAFGEALALLRERHGCRVLGVEPSEHTRQYARSKNRIELVARRIEDLHSSGTGVPPVLGAATSLDGLIDVVIMSHVLENVVHPRRALAAVRRALRADGVLYIDTCNFYYNNAVNPYHPYVFSPETLADLLARCGFDVVRQFGEPHPRRARWPSDPYLVVIARPAQPSALARAVEVAQLVADQDRGIRLRNEFKQRRAFTRALCAAIKRLTHGPSYSTYGD